MSMVTQAIERMFFSLVYRPVHREGILASHISMVRDQVNAVPQEFQNLVSLFHCRSSIAISPLLKGLHRDSCCVGYVETVFLYVYIIR
jgi:hypothetical protein